MALKNSPYRYEHLRLLHPAIAGIISRQTGIPEADIIKLDANETLTAVRRGSGQALSQYPI